MRQTIFMVERMNRIEKNKAKRKKTTENNKKEKEKKLISDHTNTHTTILFIHFKHKMR